MIDEVVRISRTVEPAILTQILTNIHANAVGILYTTVAPTEINDGKFVVVDNGTDAPLLYIKTGAGRLAYVALTV